MNKYETSKKTTSIIQGKIAVVHKGIEFCKSELAHACKSFALCVDKTTQDLTEHSQERIEYRRARNIVEEDVMEELTTPPSSDDFSSDDDSG